MLDIKKIRMNPQGVKDALGKRQGSFQVDEALELDEKRRNLLMEVEEMKAKQNSVSKEIPKLKKEGKDVSSVLEEMKNLSERVKEKDVLVKEIDEQLKKILLEIPNTPHESVVLEIGRAHV